MTLTLYRIKCNQCPLVATIAGHRQTQISILQHEKATGHYVTVFKQHRTGHCLWEMFNFQHISKHPNH